MESGALAVERLVALMKRANLEWPDPIHYDPHTKPEEIERSRRRRLSEARESFLAQDFKKTAERMLGIVRAWAQTIPIGVQPCGRSPAWRAWRRESAASS